MTLSNVGAIRCASGNAIHISPEVIEFGTVGINTLILKEETMNMFNGIDAELNKQYIIL